MKKFLVNDRAARVLVRRHGSPLYVYDAKTIRARCRELKKAFPFMRLYYACKANTNPEIVRLIAKMGFDIETTSPGEIAVARKAGVSVSRISYTCAAANEKELISIVQQGVGVHLDSLSQVEAIGRRFPGRDISVRLAHGVGVGHHAHVVTGGPESKFGIHVTHIPQLKKLALKYDLRITGLHQHIGSGGIFKPSVLLEAVDSLLEIATQFPHLEHVDFGGGFGIPYSPAEKRLPINELGRKMRARAKKFTREYGRVVEMSFEPGRYLVAEGGILLVSVTDIKRNPRKTFVDVDSGMGHLVRPIMYDSYHEIENVTHPRHRKERVTVAGLYCESGDVLAKNRLLPMPELGDILAIKNAGAYGYVMSSEYNLRPKPKEIVLH
ncbi:diaminopimelate decarboxylase [Candidatus Kaiserbacteria bacterium RIFCSPHIGHO2_01_FULL_55_17]|uniref:Diaminopimelate decarboxylase n=1 Tax=Candidatus Kaiserbacteria bacterium RIFCSPHIGHO2_01_FULL_55_17 TaxID=1798484 RepID=A0A1F6DA88_9BACT|nr:MAG: diaminopimelate decarboxylase [Candidatus Kaiserbacteria bacterium RIFCSPHIGHO2_01_FULL_55_17]